MPIQITALLPGRSSSGAARSRSLPLYDALRACVQNDAVEVCKLLLDGGMDFDKYQKWAQARRCSGHEETMAALAEHWTALQNKAQEAPAQTDGGMTLA